MRKKIKAITIYILMSLFVFSFTSMNLFASTLAVFGQNSETNTYTIDETAAMETDSVIVTLTLEETQKFKSYTVNDFKDVGCISVEDLTQDTYQYAKAKKGNITVEEKPLIDLNNYKRILKLTLDKSDKENIINVVEELNGYEMVDIATPNYLYTANSDDEEIDYYQEGDMWGLNGTHGIEANKAWRITTGESSVVVGVLDSGIQGDHPDLQYQLNQQGWHRSFISGEEGGYSAQDLEDIDGHGTHVAGTIGAMGWDEVGVNGVCWNVELVSLRVFNDFETCSDSTLISAIQYAGQKGIPILNLSGGVSVHYPGIQSALEAYNGLFICAAGNNGWNTDNTSYYPANYSYNQTFSNRIISVGAINEDGTRRHSSNYGVNSVSIYAPGENIVSAFPEHLCDSICSQPDSQLSEGLLDIKRGHVASGYHYLSGTSMAAPHVTGVAALLLSIDYSLTAAQIKTAIINSADTITIQAEENTNQTVKKLNAYKAVKYVLDNYGMSATLNSNNQTYSKEINDNYESLLGKYIMIAISVEENSLCYFTISSTNAVAVNLYDSDFLSVSCMEMYFNDGCEVRIRKYLSAGTYYVKAGFSDYGWSTIQVEFSGTLHETHAYTYQYKQYDAMYHKALCECGEYVLRPHIARVNPGTSIRRCMSCNAIVSSGSGIIQTNALNAEYVTANGSFIAPNGIIYLVDEDIEAYFADTLVFYKNFNLQVMNKHEIIFSTRRYDV